MVPLITLGIVLACLVGLYIIVFGPLIFTVPLKATLHFIGVHMNTSLKKYVCDTLLSKYLICLNVFSFFLIPKRQDRYVRIPYTTCLLQ